MDLSRPYVILIDDDEDDLELMSSSLELAGIRIKIFNSGIKALIYFSLLSSDMDLPSLIIMDYNMPKSNGHQILLLLKSRKDLKNIPVVMYSTLFTDDRKKQLYDLGALDCFIKPWAYHGLIKQAGIFRNLAYSLHLTKA